MKAQKKKQGSDEWWAGLPGQTKRGLRRLAEVSLGMLQDEVLMLTMEKHGVRPVLVCDSRPMWPPMSEAAVLKLTPEEWWASLCPFGKECFRTLAETVDKARVGDVLGIRRCGCGVQSKLVRAAQVAQATPVGGWPQGN